MWNGSKYLIELKDNAVVDITTAKYNTSGCETCDYGSNYVNEIIFHFRDGGKFLTEPCREYKYPISEAKLIIFLADNREKFKEMTYREFVTLFQELDEYIQAVDKNYSEKKFSEEVVSFYDLIKEN